MACCDKVAAMAQQLDESKEAALSFGFDTTWITDILAEYGQVALDLVIEAMRGGFSKDLVIEVLAKFGPAILEFLVTLLNKKKMAFASAENASGNVADQLAGFLDASIIEVLVQKYLPMIMEKYGEQIVQMLVEYILNSLKK